MLQQWFTWNGKEAGVAWQTIGRVKAAKISIKRRTRCWFLWTNRSSRSTVLQQPFRVSRFSSKLFATNFCLLNCLLTVCFVSDECGVKCVLSSILQMDPIKDSSSDVKFAFFGANQCGLATDLPIEDISAWLNRRKHSKEIIGRNREQTLFLEIIVPRIQNAQEICDHLKEVSFCNI